MKIFSTEKQTLLHFQLKHEKCEVERWSWGLSSELALKRVLIQILD